MQRNRADRDGLSFSATEIIGCPRRAILARQHDYYEYPEEFWARFLGTLGHFMMEYFAEDGDHIIRERRIIKEYVVDGKTIALTGKPDKIDLVRQMIFDYKFVDQVPAKARDHHIQQLNIYIDLLDGGQDIETGETVNIPITSGGIVYCGRKLARKRSVPVWTKEERLAFITDRLRPFARYEEDGTLPGILVNVLGDRASECNYCPLRAVCDAKLEAV